MHFYKQLTINNTFVNINNYKNNKLIGKYSKCFAYLVNDGNIAKWLNFFNSLAI